MRNPQKGPVRKEPAFRSGPYAEGTKSDLIIPMGIFDILSRIFRITAHSSEDNIWPMYFMNYWWKQHLSRNNIKPDQSLAL